MMKMSGRVMSCCVALILVLTSVSAVQRLRSINALKKINFGQSVPKHSLLLLHWFANTVDIDQNNIIWPTFDPDSGDYGFHQYHNSEELLDPLPWEDEYQYYTVGNLDRDTSMQLPVYVVHPPQREYEGTNMDRIIIRVRGQNTQRIDQVYITQHIAHRSEYDPYHTYRINTNLLRQIREFSVGQNQQPLWYLRDRYGSDANEVHLRNTWGDLACLGLLLFIVIKEKQSSTRKNNRQNHLDDDASESDSNVHNQCYVAVAINDDEDDETSSRTWYRESGHNNTSVPRNNNLDSFCCRCCIAICLISLIIITFIVVFFLYIKDKT